MQRRTTKAAFIRERGGVDRIQIGPVPVPDLGPTDVLVRMEASAVDHVDLFVRSGAYDTPTPFPFVLGRDLVGIVDAVGFGVPGLAPGTRVWTSSLGHGGRQGALSELVVVGIDRLYRLPDGVSALDAAPLLHTASTAHLGLSRHARLQPGEVLFVAGGGGGVGSAVIQLAAHRGATVIASASARDADWCLSLGARVVIDYAADDVDEQIARAAPDGIDVWWDNSGRHDFSALLPRMRQGGRVILMAGMTARPVLPIGAVYTRDISLLGFAISNASVTDLADSARVVNSLLAAGRLRARVGATFHLDETAAAHRAMESGDVTGRIVIVP
ncbi:NADPH:quinone reductase [Microbacterium soli]|uniref:Zinc-binding dehydrogenase n=1 Tax=Microbacterium soli TaxID=446075 RepID=A0ABP7NDN7_9MICO